MRFIYNIFYKCLIIEFVIFGKFVSILRCVLIFKIEIMFLLIGMVVILVGFVGDGVFVKGFDGV